MIETTIVFTHYALFLTAATFTLIGGVIGWVVTSYLKGRELSTLQGNLKDMKIRLAEESVAAGAERPASAAAKVSTLNKKKDRLLKDFMKRQLQQKKSLDKVTAELKEARKAKLLADRSLNAAHMSLDQWKEKCAALAEAQTKLKKSVQLQSKKSQQALSSQASEANASQKPAKTPTAVKLPVINISSAQKSVPVVTLSQNQNQNQNDTKAAPRPVQVAATAADKKAAKLTQNRTTPISTTPIDENVVTETLSSADNAQVAPVAVTAKNKRRNTAKSTATKLTTINGIGPAIEKELRKLGIQSVEQLAVLKQKQINAIDKDLGKYSGRITRQEWVKQAKALIKSSQRENAAA